MWCHPSLPSFLCLSSGRTRSSLLIPQLWLRRQGCSRSRPSLDQRTLPLLSRSPALQLHVRLNRTRLEAGLVQPQTLLGGAAPSMASTLWKMMWVEGVSQLLELSFLFEVRFRGKLYLKVLLRLETQTAPPPPPSPPCITCPVVICGPHHFMVMQCRLFDK